MPPLGKCSSRIGLADAMVIIAVVVIVVAVVVLVVATKTQHTTNF